MVLGIGIDILSLSRFEATVLRRGIPRVAKRVLCPRELTQFEGLGQTSDISLPNDVRRTQSNIDVGNASGVKGVSLPYEQKSVEEQKIWDRQLRFLSTR